MATWNPLPTGLLSPLPWESYLILSVDGQSTGLSGMVPTGEGTMWKLLSEGLDDIIFYQLCNCDNWSPNGDLQEHRETEQRIHFPIQKNNTNKPYSMHSQHVSTNWLWLCSNQHQQKTNGHISLIPQNLIVNTAAQLNLLPKNFSASHFHSKMFKTCTCFTRNQIYLKWQTKLHMFTHISMLAITRRGEKAPSVNKGWQNVSVYINRCIHIKGVL